MVIPANGMPNTKLAVTLDAALVGECAKLDPGEERALVEEGLAGSRDTWPEY